MRDPFRPNTNKQLVREAQMGFTVIGCLVAILIYVAYFRTHRFADETPTMISSSAIAATTSPGASNEEPPRTLELKQPDIGSDQQFDKPRQLLAKTEMTSRRVDAAARTIEHSIANVQSLSSVPVQQNSIGLVGNPASDQSQEFSIPSRTPKSDFNSEGSLKLTTKESDRHEPKFAGTQFNNRIAEKDSQSSLMRSPAFDVGKPNAAATPEAGFKPIPKKTRDLNPTEPKPLEKGDVSTKGIRRIPVNDKTVLRDLRQLEQASKNEHAKPIEKEPTVIKDETVKAVAYQKTTWVVKKGDSFWSIANDHYEDGRFYNALYQANRDVVPGFEDLVEGVEIQLPTKDTLIRRWPFGCPADALHKNNSWRTTPEDLMAGLKLKCDSELEKRFYVSKPGDTLFLIAQRKLGQASRYVELLKLNQFRLAEDVFHETELPAGTRIILPEN